MLQQPSFIKTVDIVAQQELPPKIGDLSIKARAPNDPHISQFTMTILVLDVMTYFQQPVPSLTLTHTRIHHDHCFIPQSVPIHINNIPSDFKIEYALKGRCHPVSRRCTLRTFIFAIHICLGEGTHRCLPCPFFRIQHTAAVIRQARRPSNLGMQR